MAQPPATTYAEPTIMWRLRNLTDGTGAHAVIVPSGSSASALWFCAGKAQECRDFVTWTGAISWLDDLLATLIRCGWTLHEPFHG